MKRVSGRIVVELDNVASDYLRKKMAGKGGSDPRDVASAAIVFLLGDPEEDDDLCSSVRTLEQAKARRVALEQKPRHRKGAR